jgi:hypothetical protein
MGNSVHLGKLSNALLIAKVLVWASKTGWTLGWIASDFAKKETKTKKNTN